MPQQKITPESIDSMIERLTTGQVTHDYPIAVEEAKTFDLPVTAVTT